MKGSRPPETDESQLHEFFVERVPPDWFEGELELAFDDAEILVVGRLTEDGDPQTTIAEHRERTRERRIQIASEAERRFRRKVAWGARSGDTGLVFTHLAIPTMTRLRLKERQVLDTLVEAGVARSRSDALAWCVRLVDRNVDEWLGELREALVNVENARKRGPDV